MQAFNSESNARAQELAFRAINYAEAMSLSTTENTILIEDTAGTCRRGHRGILVPQYVMNRRQRGASDRQDAPEDQGGALVN